MSGPVPMTLGGFQFEAFGFSFDSQEYSVETPWAEVQTAFRDDALHWTGPSGASFDISGVLFPHEFGGLDSLEGLERAAEKGQVLFLITRDGGIRGRFAIQNIRQTRELVDRSGLPHNCTYTISLRRVRRSANISLGSQLVSLLT